MSSRALFLIRLLNKPDGLGNVILFGWPFALLIQAELCEVIYYHRKLMMIFCPINIIISKIMVLLLGHLPVVSNFAILIPAFFFLPILYINFLDPLWIKLHPSSYFFINN